MKAVLFTCAVLCLFGAAVHHVKADEPAEPPITDEQALCILDVLMNTEVNVETAGEIAMDVAETFIGLIEGFMRCEAILGDPPSALEERRHEVCRLAWYATVTAELLRLRRQAQNSDFIDGVITEVEACRAL